MGEPTPELAQLEDEQRALDRLFKHALAHRVRYDEVDAQGIVGQGNWLKLIQLGRTEYLRERGLLLEGGSAPIQLVVRRAALEHLAPARFDEPLLIRTRCSYLGNSSARFETVIDSAEQLRMVVAETIAVCVEAESFRSTPWPGVFRERLQAFEEEGLQVGQAIG